MKKLATPVLLLFAAVMAYSLSSCTSFATGNNSKVEGNGKIVKQARPLKDFDGIKCSGAFNVILKQGSEFSVEVETDENLQEKVITEIKSGTLCMSMNGKVSHMSKLNVYITLPELNRMDASGACEIEFENRMNAKTLDMDLSGAVSVKANLNAKSINGDISGAVNLKMEGTADELNLKASGAVEIKGLGLICGKADIDASGAAYIEINPATDLHSKTSGASSISRDASGNK
ncbi:MAG: head GIN domain-containing protein [Bacteroidota bacterium]